jgi:hypothetical protein
MREFGWSFISERDFSTENMSEVRSVVQEVFILYQKASWNQILIYFRKMNLHASMYSVFLLF